jgi:hypothetical protein
MRSPGYATAATFETLLTRTTVRRVLDVYFAGFGLAFAVHFLVLPVSSRTMATLILTEYIHAFKGLVDANAALLVSVPSRQWNNASKASSLESDNDADHSDRVQVWPEAERWRKFTDAVTECQIKLQSEMRYIKREVAFGKLAGADFSKLAKLLKNILVPISGLEAVVQINDRIERKAEWNTVRTHKDDGGNEMSDRSLTEAELEHWNKLFTKIEPSFRDMCHAMIEGVDYALSTLEVTKKPAFSSKEDLKKTNTEDGAGHGISKRVESAITQFLLEREEPVREWCRLTGLEESRLTNRDAHQRRTSQLYLLLDVSGLAKNTKQLITVSA